MASLKQAVILCGGRGTRLGQLTQQVPKPLILVDGVPLLERTLNTLWEQGIREFILLNGHLATAIKDYIKRSVWAERQVTLFKEDKPLGTSGALPLVKEKLAENFLVVYGDVFLDFKLSPLIKKHLATQALATLLIRQSDHPWDSDLVEVNPTGEVKSWHSKGKNPENTANWGNAAFYVCQKDLLKAIEVGAFSGFAEDVFPKLVEQGTKIQTYQLPENQWVCDMGTPDRIGKVEEYLQRKIKAKQAQENPKKIETLFLDRDGTLNQLNGLVDHPEKLKLIDGVAEALGALDKAGITCFVVTNQPVIARGLCSQKTLNEIHQKLNREVEAKGGKLKKIYYSPYHPETQHGEGIKEFRRASSCRKPRPGMIFQAQEEWGIDLAACALVGDSWRDMEAAKAAGIRSIAVGEESRKLESQAYFTDFPIFVNHFLANKIPSCLAKQN